MFFVYGVSMTLARKEAAKKCSQYEGTYPNRRELSPAEYQAKLEKMAAEKFEKMRPQKLSHSLSTPALCSQYIALAQRQDKCRDLHIRYRKPTGKVNPKTKKEVIAWEVYNGEMAA
ncbi:hypothetical protein ACE02Z_16275 [Shewanella xiamenensis]|uniref:hypothetical protein n=1 Tax=Shewanella xiamenensis TaxID=332186 RepID=UPI00313C73AC